MRGAPFDTLFLALSGARVMDEMPRQWFLSPLAETALWAMSGKDGLGIYQMERLRGHRPRLFGLPYEVDRGLDDQRWRLVTNRAWTYHGDVTEKAVLRLRKTPRDSFGNAEPVEADDFYRRPFWLTPDWSGGDNLRDAGTEPFWML